MSYHKPTQQRYFKSEKGKAAIKRYESSDKRRRERQNTRKKNHQSCREQDNARSKTYYKKHDKYFKLKNKEWNEKNGDKWKERRAKISLEWTMNKCSSALVEKTFENLGASLTVEQEITVIEKTIISINVKTMPAKIEYLLDEELDLTGGEIEILYNDESIKEILTSKEISISRF